MKNMLHNIKIRLVFCVKVLYLCRVKVFYPLNRLIMMDMMCVNRRFLFRWVLLLGMCMWLSPAMGAAWDVCHENFYPTTYGAGTQNWQVCQQRNGWIYAANNYGLLQYDGVDWRLFGLQNATVVRSIELDDDGNIYAGGTNEFGYFRGNGRGGYAYTSLSDSLPEAYRNFGEVWSIVQIDDYVYMQTHSCIFVYQKDAQACPQFHRVIEPDMHIYLMEQFNNGLYVATAKGIYILAGTQLNALQGSEQLRGYEVRAMAALDDRRLLIATDFNGIWCYDGTSVKPYKTEMDAYLHHNQLYTLEVGERYIAVGTVLRGLLLLDKQGRLVQQISRRNGLQNNTVLSLLFDDNGNLWCGLDQGIDCLHMNEPVTYLREDNLSYGSGYASCLQGNTLYLGTNQGLYMTSCHPETMEIGKLEVVPGSLGQVWNLQEVNGTLFCCHHRGLFTVENKRLHPLITEEGVWCVREWKDGYLLAGSYRGIYLLDAEHRTLNAERYEVVRKIAGFDDTSLHFEVDGTGGIWIISHRGVEKLTLNASLDLFTAEMIYANEDESNYIDIQKIDDRILITSNDYCRMISAAGTVESASSFLSSLEGERHYAHIWKDKDNNIWYQIGNSLKVHPYDAHTRTYAADAYALVSEQNIFIGGFPNLYLLPNKQAILGSIDGFYLLDTEHRTLNAEHRTKDAERLFIRKVTLLNRDNEVVYGESYKTEKKRIDLPADIYTMRVDYGGFALHYEGVQYATRLLPEEENFSAYSGGTTRELSNLRDGEYTFEVKMLLPQTNEVCTTQFCFTIATPWYRTLWAFISYGLLVILVIMVVVYIVHILMVRDQQRIEDEKNKELQEQENRYKIEVREQEVKILQLENEKTQAELKSKSQELSNLLLTQVNRHELVSELQGELRKVTDLLQDNNQRAAVDKLRQLQAKLGKSAEAEIDWKRFEENFDVVNNRFLKKLSARFPWMTKNERKLCVYIRMGLYTKEIAPLMNLSTRGVEMMRYRVRQKMGLDAQANLKAYFAMIAEENGEETILQNYTPNNISEST